MCNSNVSRGSGLGLRAWLVGTALVLATAAARADDASCAEQERVGIVSERLAPSIVIPQLAPICYGVPEEQNALTRDVRAFIDKDPTSARLATALLTLAMRVKEDDTFGPQATRDAFATSARAAAADVAKNLPSGQGNTSPIAWQIENGTARAVGGLNIIRILNDGCPSGDPALNTCQNAIRAAKAWFRATQLADAALSRYSAAFIDALLARSTARLAMWHAYRDEALPQFQWEWLLNSWRLNKADKGPNGRPLDANRQPIGPMAVPTDQIIFLHPGVGLEYRDKPDKPGGTDSKTSPIVYLELIGRYRWSWNESTGQMIGGNGVSLVATYADRNTDTEVGYGLLFHSRMTKAYTLGITRSGDATNIIFNADLAEFFKDRMTYWKGVGQQIESIKIAVPTPVP